MTWSCVLLVNIVCNIGLQEYRMFYYAIGKKIDITYRLFASLTIVLVEKFKVLTVATKTFLQVQCLQ